jgi:diadenylate cyclase
MTLPVEYYNRPPSFDILETSTNEVKLQINGSSALIRSLRPGQVEVRVDLGKAVDGVNLIPVTKENIGLPPGISVSKVDPPLVKITLDKPITKELPIQVDWVGHLPGDYNLVEVKLSPDVAKVIGGKDTLNKINTIYTVPVRLDTLQQNGSALVPIVLNPPSLKLAPGAIDRVTITYRLVERSRTEEEKAP